MLRAKLTLRTRTSPRISPTTRPSTSMPSVSNEAAHTDDQAVDIKVKKDKLFQRASPMKLVSLYPSMSGKHKQLIEVCGYRGLVNIKCSKLQPYLCKFLMQSFNPSTCKLVFSGRGSIDVTEESVEEVIGVPRGDIDVRYEMDSATIRFMTEQLGEKSKRQPTITSLKKKLSGIKEANTSYLRLFITYGMSSVLAPTTGVHISPRLYPSMINIRSAHRLNMCKFFIMMLWKAAKSKFEKGILKSCMLYFMVKYLDSLKLEGIDVPSEGTRVSAWTNAMVLKAIKQDQRSDGTFGAAPLKPEFAFTPEVEEDPDQGTSNGGAFEEDHETPREEQQEEEHEEPYEEVHEEEHEQPCEEEGKQSILFLDVEKIDLFIQANAPPTCTLRERARYKEAVQKACHGFESESLPWFRVKSAYATQGTFIQTKEIT